MFNTHIHPSRGKLIPGPFKVAVTEATVEQIRRVERKAKQTWMDGDISNSWKKETSER